LTSKHTERKLKTKWQKTTTQKLKNF
jgi:hypothetical protein